VSDDTANLLLNALPLVALLATAAVLWIRDRRR